MCYYLGLIDRGGLKFSTDFLLTICSTTSLMFESFINKYEKQFLLFENQRKLLVSLSLDFISTLYEGEVCSCSNDLYKLIKIASRIMANILE